MYSIDNLDARVKIILDWEEHFGELSGIYNILGQKVGVTDADFRKLPRGIYIVNGKKVIK